MRRHEPYPFYKNTNVVKEERRRRRKRALPPSTGAGLASERSEDDLMPPPGIGAQSSISSEQTRSTQRPATTNAPMRSRSLSGISHARTPSRGGSGARRAQQLGDLLPSLFDDQHIPDSLIPAESMARANAPGSSVWPLSNLLSQPSYNATPQGQVDVESVKRWVHFMNARVEQGTGRVLPEDALEDLHNIQYMGFHELVRQVMVSNFSRGEALLDLWRMKTELDDLEKQELKRKIAALERRPRTTVHASRPAIAAGRKSVHARRSVHRASVFDTATLVRVEEQRFPDATPFQISSLEKTATKGGTYASSASRALPKPNEPRRKSSILPIFERFFIDLEADLPNQPSKSAQSLDPDEHARTKALYRDLCSALERVHELEQENQRLRLSGNANLSTE